MIASIALFVYGDSSILEKSKSLYAVAVDVLVSVVDFFVSHSFPSRIILYVIRTARVEVNIVEWWNVIWNK